MVQPVRLSRATVAAIVLCCVLASASGSVWAMGGQKNHPNKHDEKKQVEALEEQWRMAQLASDVATMEKMLADDFIGISISGQVNTKAQQLDRVKSRKLVVTRLELSDMKVKLVDSVAIVTSVADVEGTSEGTSVKGRYRYTRVYQRMLWGAWKITSFEATRIEPRTERSKEQPQGQDATPGHAKSEEPRFR
jgi:ketosteroid isomerase-like protein